MWVRGVTPAAPCGALSSGVDEQVGVTGAGPGQEGARDVPSAVVADEFHNGRPRPLMVAWAQQPGFDSISSEAAEGRVPDLYGAVRRIDGL